MMAMDDWNEDTDGHGVKDQMDSDDAGDGIHDGKEDEDGDGVANDEDADDDGDGISDENYEL